MALALLLILPPVIIFLNHFVYQIQKNLPPGPNALHVLVHLWQLITKPHIALQTLSQIYGPLMSFHLGNQLLIVASSPDTAKEFCKTRDRIFSGRHLPSVYSNLPGMMHSSIVLSPECDDPWKFLRLIGRKCMFSSQAIESNAWIRKAKTAEMVDYLRTKEGEFVNLEDIMFATVANIVSSVLVSRDLFDIRRQGESDYNAMMDLVIEVVRMVLAPAWVDFVPIPKRNFWSKRKAMDLHRKVKVMWGGCLAFRHENPSSRPDFMDTVRDEDSTYSEERILNTLTELFIGATDSTTVTTVWLMVELLRKQEALYRVRDEIAEAIVEGELSDSLLTQCHYFQACIKETLRLHFPAPMLVPHRAIETCKVNDYVILKDSMLLVNAWAIARDPNYWEDATSFKPERFLESKISHRGTHFEYLPFGTGLRMCPGSDAAFKNIQMVVGSLLHHFDWSLPNGEHLSTIDANEMYVVTLKKETPLFLVPKLRM